MPGFRLVTTKTLTPGQSPAGGSTITWSVVSSANIPYQSRKFGSSRRDPSRYSFDWANASSSSTLSIQTSATPWNGGSDSCGPKGTRVLIR